MRSLLASSAAAFGLIALTPSVASAQTPIGPDQHFLGSVNGTDDHAVVNVVCPGPAQGGTGRVAGGQTMSVAGVARGGGFTGPFSQVYAWFVPKAGSSGRPTMIDFTSYGRPQRIPTSIQVPCAGTGRVEFSSCPYLAPCAAGWVPQYVKVSYANMAA